MKMTLQNISNKPWSEKRGRGLGTSSLLPIQIDGRTQHPSPLILKAFTACKTKAALCPPTRTSLTGSCSSHFISDRKTAWWLLQLSWLSLAAAWNIGEYEKNWVVLLIHSMFWKAKDDQHLNFPYSQNPHKIAKRKTEQYEKSLTVSTITSF